MKKSEVLKIIDEVMNNREIDSIRNAILAIRDKVKELPDDDKYCATLRLRSTDNEPCCISEYYSGARFIHIDTSYKIDTGIYGAYWFSDEEEEL